MTNNSKIHLSNVLTESDDDVLDTLIENSCNTEISSEQKSEQVCYNSENNDDIACKTVEKLEKTDKNQYLTPFINPDFCKYDDICVKMNDISKEFDKDVTITIANIGDKARDTTRLIHKWVDNAIAAKQNKKRLEKEYQDYKKRITDMVQNSGKNKAFLEKRMSIDSIVQNDTGVKNIRNALEEAKQLEELYLYYADIIKGFGYNVRSSLDTLVFERGM